MEVIRTYQDTLKPTIFLAGPIQSAPDWHSSAISVLQKYDIDTGQERDIDIASPKMVDKPNNWKYEDQVEWETRYLNHSAYNGSVLFWLANPIESNLDPSRSYAQTTRFELSEWFGKMSFNSNIKLCVGIEPGFHGERYIRKRFADVGIKIHDNLYDTCIDAYYILVRRYLK